MEICPSAGAAPGQCQVRTLPWLSYSTIRLGQGNNFDTRNMMLNISIFIILILLGSFLWVGHTCELVGILRSFSYHRGQYPTHPRLSSDGFLCTQYPPSRQTFQNLKVSDFLTEPPIGVLYSSVISLSLTIKIWSLGLRCLNP